SLRIVDVIETRYPKFPGLNLTHEVREGLQKHARFYRTGGDIHAQPSLEAQVANLADEITYYTHDLEDGLDFALLDVEQLSALEVWSGTGAEGLRHFLRLKGVVLSDYIIRSILDREVA